MNEEVRTFVKAVMSEKGLSQGEIARRTGLARPVVTRLLSGTVGKIPENWQRILDELEVDIVAVKRSERTK